MTMVTVVEEEKEEEKSVLAEVAPKRVITGKRQLVEGMDPYHPFRKKLTGREVMMIKRKLGMPAKAKLPLCPCKSKMKIKVLKALGDIVHGEKSHGPCKECGCPYVAGTGTKHYGWGWCHWHEMRHSPKVNEEFAASHLLSLQQHNPHAYYEAEEVIVEIIKKGERAEEEIALEKIILDANDLAGEFFRCLTDFEKQRRNARPYVEKIDALVTAITTHKEIPEQQWLEIYDCLQLIRAKMESPLTEKTSGGLVPMSDKTRLYAIATIAEKMARATKIWYEIKRADAVMANDLNIWVKRLFLNFQQAFGETTYKNEQGRDVRIIETLAACIVKAGEPRRGM